jgi:hypothetical protein
MQASASTPATAVDQSKTDDGAIRPFKVERCSCGRRVRR